MSVKKLCTVGAALLSLATVPVTAAPVLLPPTVPIGGLTQAQQSGEWWRWAISFPSGANPVQETTGALSFVGDRGPVFFLAGAFVGPNGVGTADRSVTVREGQTLFFPLVNAVSDSDFLTSVLGIPNPTTAQIRQDAADTLGAGSGLYVRLNGADLPLPPGIASLNDFYHLESFEYSFPPGNVFGAPPGGPFEAASAGYWVAVGGLTPGQYTLQFGGVATGVGLYEGFTNTQQITYRVTVQAVPEPASVAVLGGLLAAAGAWATRRRTGA
jgi:hypothetical protein